MSFVIHSMPGGSNALRGADGGTTDRCEPALRLGLGLTIRAACDRPNSPPAIDNGTSFGAASYGAASEQPCSREDVLAANRRALLAGAYCLAGFQADAPERRHAYGGTYDLAELRRLPLPPTRP